ncbi:MAG: TetR/AcrR family transcriptional regulator [Acidimicrobiia bacterium]
MTDAPSPKEQRRRQHRELSRMQILDAAEHVFARKGFHDATVKEIAATAEFSVGGVYSFFAEKDDIFVDIFLRRGSEFMEGMRAVLADPGGARQTMHRLADYQVRFFREHPDFGKLFLRSSGITIGDLDSKIDRTAVDNYTEAMNLQAKLFRAGQEAGELRDGDPEVLAQLFSGIVSAYQASDPLVIDGGGGSAGGAGTERMTLPELHEILDGAFSSP